VSWSFFPSSFLAFTPIFFAVIETPSSFYVFGGGPSLLLSLYSRLHSRSFPPFSPPCNISPSRRTLRVAIPPNPPGSCRRFSLHVRRRPASPPLFSPLLLFRSKFFGRFKVFFPCLRTGGVYLNSRPPLRLPSPPRLCAMTDPPS